MSATRKRRRYRTGVDTNLANASAGAQNSDLEGRLAGCSRAALHGGLRLR